MAKFLRYLPTDVRKKYEGKLPVPVVAIANELGIGIYETANFAKHESGSIRKDKEGYAIYVKEQDPPARKRFTIAHEIGHFLLHNNLLDSGKEHVDQIKQPVTHLKRQTSKVAGVTDHEREMQANQFAAELLMPDDLFKKAWEDATSLDDVTIKFEVSPSAATVRAKELVGTFIV